MGKITRREQLAQMLNGCEYRNEMDGQATQFAKEHQLIVLYGASDDLLEVDGVVNDEYGANDGANFVVIPCGIEYDADGYENIGGIFSLAVDNKLRIPNVDKSKFHRVSAEWCPSGTNASWRITSTLPYSSFEVMEDGDIYCYGAVISLDDIVELNK